MKRISYALIAMILTTFILSCSGSIENASTPQRPATEATESENVTSTEPEKVYSQKPSVILYSGWVLYLEDKDGKYVASAQASTGDVAYIIYENSSKVEIKEAPRKLSSGEDKVDLVKVMYNDTEYWTRTIFISDGGIPAMIYDEDGARIFSAADLANRTDKKLNFRDSVAYIDSVDEDFCKVVIYSGTEYGKEIFIENDAITTDEDKIDIQKTLINMDALGDKLDPAVEEELYSIIHNYWLSQDDSYYPDEY